MTIKKSKSAKSPRSMKSTRSSKSIKYKKTSAKIQSKTRAKKTINGGSEETDKKRKRKPIMPNISAGRITPGYISNIPPLTEEEFSNLIDQISIGPQIVSIPVPPYRHAFLIDVQPKRIMVSDWGGEKNARLGLLKGKKYEGWRQYTALMIQLENKYKLPIQYYPVDEILHATAEQQSCDAGGGGCSKYIYDWVKIYYPEYS
jgi:hypothetical protein